MLKRLSASLGLVFAAFFATTGISDAAVLETQDDVIYAAGATVAVLIVLVTLAYSVKVLTGWERNLPPAENERELGIRKSGFGGAAFDAEYGHEHHDADHAPPADLQPDKSGQADAHGAAAAHGAH